MEAFFSGAIGALFVAAIIFILILWYNEPKY